MSLGSDDPPSPWSIINRKPHVTGNDASEASFRSIRDWVHSCNLEHKRCSNESTAMLPTRVLDLGQTNDSIRLVETKALSGPYICLSYCWGRTLTILCTRENYESYRGNIPWSSLPLLFQNAVEICRMLSIQYLWTDKLCIIQHDKEDWETEGSRMAQIFEGSFLTIGAAISKNDSESLFSQGKKHVSNVKRHDGHLEDGSPFTIYSRTPVECHPANMASSGYDRGQYPLMTRAWVYQERLLAPRVLYFGEELSWECRETSTCECLGANRGTKHDHSLSLVQGVSSETLFTHWQKMVEEFTRLQLSNEEDRLPALSGLAHQYEHRLESSYLAGLWEDNLLADMLWFAYPESGSQAERYYTKRPKKWRAPSWSWASVEGPILFFKPDLTANAVTDVKSLTWWIDITSAQCTPSSLDPMGTVAKGHLVIKGSGRPAYLKHREACEGHVTRHFSVGHPSSGSIHIRSNFTVDGQEANVDYDLIERGLMNPNSDMSVYCLFLGGISLTQRVFVRDQDKYISSPVLRTWSLLLYCVEGEIFERVGMLVSDHFDEDEFQFRKRYNQRVITVI